MLKSFCLSVGLAAAAIAGPATATASAQGAQTIPAQAKPAQTKPGPAAPGKQADTLSGDWLLSTSEFDGDCKITGNMTFRPTSIPGNYTCVFETEQICGPMHGNMYIRVTQTCTATMIGRQVAIKSAVKRVEESRVDGLPGWKSNYLADNFIVTMQKGFGEMIGDHYDEQRELKARFWRDNALVS
jgi:hypothetical protein